MNKKPLSTHFLLVILMGLIFILNPLKVFAQDSLPSVEEVIENYINALGGREAIEKLTTRTFTGHLVKDVLWEDPPYDVAHLKIYSKMPDKFLMNIFDSAYDENMVYNGEAGWRKDAKGIHSDDYIGKTSTAWLLNPQHAIHMKDYFKGLQITGRETIKDRTVYVIESEGHSKEYFGLYFDVETGLLLRIGYHHDLLDYRIVDGVMIPFRIIFGRKGGAYTYFFSEVKHNEQIDDNLFEKPSFKGMELYSYTEDGKNITYTLLTGTNRLKLPEEIIGSSIDIEELIGHIKKLASGETIFWVNDRLSGKLSNHIKFLYPDEQTIENIKSVCKKYNITLYIEDMDNEEN
jgi:hypothetical protein